MKLIVGLGNPGVRYRWTRHNLGFIVIEEFAKYVNVILKKKELLKAYIGYKQIGQTKLIFLKPLTYVNCSGEVVKRVVDRYNIDISDILIVCDDLNLPLGKLRIKKQGSDGGHNGLKSIINCLKAKEFARLRIGILNPQATRLPISGGQASRTPQAADYVLAKFTGKEKKIVKEVVAGAVQAIEIVIKEGIEKAMNEYN